LICGACAACVAKEGSTRESSALLMTRTMTVVCQPRSCERLSRLANGRRLFGRLVPTIERRTIRAVDDAHGCGFPMLRAVPRHVGPKALAGCSHPLQRLSVSVAGRLASQRPVQPRRVLSVSCFPRFLPCPPGHRSCCSPTLINICPGTGIGLGRDVARTAHELVFRVHGGSLSRRRPAISRDLISLPRRLQKRFDAASRN
jgi:hypothetical protein